MEGQNVTEADLANWFCYHAPGPGMPEVYQAIRNSGLGLAEAIFEFTPPGLDQRRAIETVRDAVMRANQALACATGPEQLAVVENYRRLTIDPLEGV